MLRIGAVSGSDQHGDLLTTKTTFTTKAETMTGKNQHVVPHEGKWAVKGEGNRRATSIHDTQTAATDRAREIARRQKSELLVHGRDGEIRSRDSFGHDPFPPKG